MSRRLFLKTLSAAALTPTLPRPSAHAQSRARPRRLVVFFTPHGAPAEFFWPQGPTALTSSHILEPLEPFRDQLSVIRGLDYIGSDNHPAIKDVLTNHTTRSLDHVVADHLGQQTPVRALHLGVVPDYPRSFTVDGQFSFDNGPVPHEADPVKAFDTLFASTSAGADTAGAEQVASQRRQMVDFTRGEVEALRARVQDLPAEVAKLDGHWAALQNLRSAPAAAVGADCSALSLPTVEALRERGADPWAHENFPDVMDAQIDVAAAALRCGVTRVVSLQAMYVNAQISFSFAGVARGHHDASHSSPDTPGRRQHADCQRWMATRLLRLLEALNVSDPEDPEHTLLDNSCVLWCSEIGDGQAHTCIAVPTVVLGSAGGSLRPGRLLEYSGRSHSGLLMTIANAMGLELTEFGPNSEAGSLQELEVG